MSLLMTPEPPGSALHYNTTNDYLFTYRYMNVQLQLHGPHTAGLWFHAVQTNYQANEVIQKFFLPTKLRKQ